MDQFVVRGRAEASLEDPLQRRAPGPQSVLALLKAAARQRSRPQRAPDAAPSAHSRDQEPINRVNAPVRIPSGGAGSPESPIEDEDGAADAPGPSQTGPAVRTGRRQWSIKQSLDVARSREHDCLVSAKRREVAWLRRLDAQRHGPLAFAERREAVRRRWACSHWSAHLRLGDGADGVDAGRRRSAEAVRAIAPSPGGAWLAVGTRGEDVPVFSAPALRQRVRAGEADTAEPAWYLRASRECVALRWIRGVRPDAPGGGGTALVVASALGPISIFVLPAASSGRESAAAMTPAARFNAAPASSTRHAAGPASGPRSVCDVAVLPQTAGSAGDRAGGVTCRIAVLLSDGVVSVWEVSLVGEGATRTVRPPPPPPPPPPRAHACAAACTSSSACRARRPRRRSRSSRWRERLTSWWWARQTAVYWCERARSRRPAGEVAGKHRAAASAPSRPAVSLQHIDLSKLTPPAFGGVPTPRHLASCTLHAALASASPPLLGREQEGRGVLSLCPAPRAAAGASGEGPHASAILECGASVLVHLSTLKPLLAHSHGVSAALDGIRARAADAAEPDSTGRRGGDATNPAIAAPLALSSAEQTRWGSALASAGASDGVRRSALRGLQRSRWLTSRHALVAYTEGGSVMVHCDRAVTALEFVDACPQAGAPSAVTTAAIARTALPAAPAEAEGRDSGLDGVSSQRPSSPVAATGAGGLHGAGGHPQAEEDSPNRSLRELADSVARDSSRALSIPAFASQPRKGPLPLSDALQRMAAQRNRGQSAPSASPREEGAGNPAGGRLTALARKRLGGSKLLATGRTPGGGLRAAAPRAAAPAKAAALSSPEQARLQRRRMKAEARKRRSAGAGKASVPSRSVPAQAKSEEVTVGLRVPPSVTVVPAGGDAVRGPLTALCADPVSGWLWVGTDRGTMHCATPQVP